MRVYDHSADSPVLWLRLDPDMTLLRSTFIEQPDYQWQYQLRHERDVTAQMEAISALERYPTPATRLALTDTIENEQSYYKVRCRAAHCLTKVRVYCQLLQAITGCVYTLSHFIT
jgi:transcription initiation factor TFIID subunit 2